MNKAMITLGKWVILAFTLTAVAWGATTTALAKGGPEGQAATIYLAPHPDDEFQFWSLLEEQATDYKILVVLNRGEQTAYCERETWESALQADLGELPPSPEPDGRWTLDCEEARISSLLGFMSEMAASDPGIPGIFSEPATHGPLDEAGRELCRMDGEEVRNCGDEIREARVWLDAEERGAVVFFNLGDGDLTQDSVAWAVESLLAHREEWGLAPEIPVSSIVGAFANDGSTPASNTPTPITSPCMTPSGTSTSRWVPSWEPPACWIPANR